MIGQVHEIEMIEVRLELAGDEASILRAKAKRDDGPRVAQDGMPNIRLEVMQVTGSTSGVIRRWMRTLSGPPSCSLIREYEITLEIEVDAMMGQRRPQQYRVRNQGNVLGRDARQRIHRAHQR